MKTLRDEFDGMGFGQHATWYHSRFLDKYGSYRVVEGVLTVSGTKVGLMQEGYTHPHILGTCGDHVKLLLPPEEKEWEYEPDLWKHVHRVEGALGKSRTRADKYEKQLQAIKGILDDEEA